MTLDGAGFEQGVGAAEQHFFFFGLIWTIWVALPVH